MQYIFSVAVGTSNYEIFIKREFLIQSFFVLLNLIKTIFCWFLFNNNNITEFSMNVRQKRYCIMGRFNTIYFWFVCVLTNKNSLWKKKCKCWKYYLAEYLSLANMFICLYQHFKSCCLILIKYLQEATPNMMCSVNKRDANFFAYKVHFSRKHVYWLPRSSIDENTNSIYQWSCRIKKLMEKLIIINGWMIIIFLLHITDAMSNVQPNHF